MWSYIARRSGYMLVILIISSIAIFYSLRLEPGSPAGIALSPLAAARARAQYRAQVGLDLPLYQQYLVYVANLVRGNFGYSLINGTPVIQEIGIYGRNSLALDALALAITYLVALPVGIVAALQRGRWADYLSMGVASLGMGIPNFWLALLLIYLFSLQLNWLPSSGNIVLPAVVLAVEGVAVVMRMVRSSALEQLHQDFVRTLHAKGLPYWQIVWKHVLRNSLIPIISLSGLRVGQLIGYTLIVEVIFRWPGVGFLLVTAIEQRDYPVVQFFAMLLVTCVVAANWFADLASAWANPRIRRVRVAA